MSCDCLFCDLLRGFDSHTQRHLNLHVSGHVTFATKFPAKFGLLYACSPAQIRSVTLAAMFFLTRTAFSAAPCTAPCNGPCETKTGCSGSTCGVRAYKCLFDCLRVHEC
jgi:hypothetical protein